MSNHDCSPIEERDAGEVTDVFGTRIAPDDVEALNIAFDVTPAELITGIITEVGVLEPPAAVLPARELLGDMLHELGRPERVARAESFPAKSGRSPPRSEGSRLRVSDRLRRSYSVGRWRSRLFRQGDSP